MKRTDPQFKLRLPEVLKARLEESAAQANRSVNAEIVFRLESSYPQSIRDPDTKPDVQRILDEFQLSVQHTMAAQRALEEMLETRRAGISEGDFRQLTTAAQKLAKKR